MIVAMSTGVREQEARPRLVGPAADGRRDQLGPSLRAARNNPGRCTSNNHVRAAAIALLLPLGCKPTASTAAPSAPSTSSSAAPATESVAPSNPSGTGAGEPISEAQRLERIHRRFEPAERRFVHDLERWAKADPATRGPKPQRQTYLDEAMRAWGQRRLQSARTDRERAGHAEQPALNVAALDPVDRVYALDPTKVGAQRFDRAAAAFEPEVTEHAELLRGLAASARGEHETAARHFDAAVRADLEARRASFADPDAKPPAAVAALLASAVNKAEPNDFTRELTARYGLNASPSGRVIVVTGTFVDPEAVRVFVEDARGGLSFTNLDARDQRHGDFAGAIIHADAERGGAVLVRATTRVDAEHPLVGVVYVLTPSGVAVHPYTLTRGSAVVEAPIQ